jgi:hypothetical protein
MNTAETHVLDPLPHSPDEISGESIPVSLHRFSQSVISLRPTSSGLPLIVSPPTLERGLTSSVVVDFYYDTLF